MTAVLAAPLFDPGSARVQLDLPEGLTVAQIVARALPVRASAERGQLRVALVTADAATVVYPALWHAIRPKPGVQVVIRVIPAGDALRSVLSIVVSIAAVAFAGPLAGVLGITSKLGVSLLTLGLNVLGTLAINALIPPPKPEEKRPSYSISGWQNRYEPDGAVPVVLGTHRYAAPFAVMSYTEIVGDWQYVRAVLNYGYGPLNLSEFRLGQTPLSEYDEVEIETREGRAGDAHLSLVSRQVLEEAIGVELTRPLYRDDEGNVTKAPTDPDSITDQVLDGWTNSATDGRETPVVRTTAADVTSVSLIFAFPAGLVSFNKKGKKRSYSVAIRIRQRPAGTTAWAAVTTLTLRSAQSEAFYRQHSWSFPTRGRWEIELTRMTDETDSSQVSDRVVWAALQSIRPEYPLAFNQPLALVALRIKATHQINGSLDNFSALCRRPCLDYEHTTGKWVERVTSNPASIYRYVLTSPANPRPVTLAQLDLDQLEAWHDYCRVHSLTYNRVLDEAGTTLRDVLTEIAAAGRASPRHDGLRWGVIVDSTVDRLIVDHLTPRNSWGFRATRNYFDPPHAMRCKFLDATNDNAPAERLVRWPGYTGEITLTEAYDQPGVTNPAQVWLGARRRMYEALHRPDSYELMQAGSVRVVTRGDWVAVSTDVLDSVQRTARVVNVQGELVEIDEEVSLSAAVSYAIRWRAGIASADTIGRSVVRRVTGVGANPTRLLRLMDGGEAPVAGDLIMLGKGGQESRTMIVTGIEMGEDDTQLIRLIDAAPQIDALLAADTPPAWSGRAGVEIGGSTAMPPAPVWAGIKSGAAETGYPDRIVYLIRPGTGAVRAAQIRVQWRKAGQVWSSTDIPVAAGGGTLTGFARGDLVEMTAAAISSTGVVGPGTPVMTVHVGAADADLPGGLESISLTPLLGAARLSFDTDDSGSTAEVQVYRAQTATLDRSAHKTGAPIAVSASRTYSVTLGDATRLNMLGASGAFDAGDGWTLGAGWTVSQGAAQHEPGEESWMGRLVPSIEGRWYRCSYRAVTVSGGNVAARLGGLPPAIGALRSTPGVWRDRLQAPDGVAGMTNTFGILAGAGVEASVDDLVIYPETATCLAQGTHYIWLEPRNADGQPGPVIGPFTVTVT